MKTTIINFRNKLDQNTPDNASFTVLGDSGILTDRIISLTADDEIGFSKIISCLDGALFIIGTADFDITKILSNQALTQCDDGTFRSLDNGDIKVAVLSSDQASLKSMCDKLICEWGLYWSKQVFKLFGTDISTLKTVLNGITELSPEIYYYINENNLDIKVTLFFGKGAKKSDADMAIKRFIISLSGDIYANDDVALEKRLVELLKLRRLTVSSAESMTGGLIASKIVSVSGASKYFYEGAVTYNTEAKIQRLGVSVDVVKQYGVVSDKVASQMVRGLLLTKNCTVATSVTGYADGDESSSGKCFIGVGGFDTIDVYQFKFDGDRNSVRQKAANASLFLMIKKISDI